MAKSKVIEVLKNIKIEEYFAIVISLISLIILFSLGSFHYNLSYLLTTGSKAIKESAKWFQWGIVVFVSFYFVVKFIAFLAGIFEKFFFGREKCSTVSVNYLNKQFLVQSLKFFLRPILTILTPFSLFLLLIGGMRPRIENRLADLQLLKIDKLLTGTYPFLQLHSPSNPFRFLLDFLAHPIIDSFFALSVIMGLLVLFFYLDNDQKLFKGYILASFIVVILALPLWYFFPAQSPANAFLNKTNNANLPPSLLVQLNNYHPNSDVSATQESLWKQQKQNPPLTTFPSAHWAWGAIVVYYLFKKKRWTIFLSLPWFFLASLGTIYLGCHYLIDGIVALFLAVPSIYISNLLIKLERRYYIENPQEINFAQTIKIKFLEPFKKIQCLSPF